MLNKRFSWLFAAVCLLALGLIGCSQESSDDSARAKQPQTEAPDRAGFSGQIGVYNEVH